VPGFCLFGLRDFDAEFNTHMTSCVESPCGCVADVQLD
jgi:hypothetical protein